MTMGDKGHDPSEYRRIVREAKSKGTPALLDRARKLSDPYFRAKALVDLATMSWVDAPKEVVLEGLDHVKDAEPPWRKAEVLTEICKRLGKLKDGPELLDRVVEIIIQMPNGKGLADAVQGCSPKMDIEQGLKLLERSLKNEGHELDGSKTVLRSIVKAKGYDWGALDRTMMIIGNVEDPALVSKLMGYLNVQVGRSGKSTKAPLAEALEFASNIDDPVVKLDTYRYLVSTAAMNMEQVLLAGEWAEKLELPTSRASMLCVLGGKADKLGSKDKAVEWFNNAREVLYTVDDPGAKGAALINVAKGLHMCGEDSALEVFSQVKELTTQMDGPTRAGLERKLSDTMQKEGLEVPEDLVVEKKEVEAPAHTGPGHVLALYDSYEGGIGTIHIRTVARAAPVCYAFGLDLALIGFPVKDLETFLEMVKKDTNVGKGGRYLNRLFEDGRVRLIPCDRACCPEGLDNIGVPVATTSKPWDGRNISMQEAAGKGDKVLLLMGLGKQGLPKAVLEGCPYHLELTGMRIPLETCTAMGIMAERLGALNR